MGGLFLFVEVSERQGKASGLSDLSFGLRKQSSSFIFDVHWYEPKFPVQKPTSVTKQKYLELAMSNMGEKAQDSEVLFALAPKI